MCAQTCSQCYMFCSITYGFGYGHICLNCCRFLSCPIFTTKFHSFHVNSQHKKNTMLPLKSRKAYRDVASFLVLGYQVICVVIYIGEYVSTYCRPCAYEVKEPAQYSYNLSGHVLESHLSMSSTMYCCYSLS